MSLTKEDIAILAIIRDALGTLYGSTSFTGDYQLVYLLDIIKRTRPRFYLGIMSTGTGKSSAFHVSAYVQQQNWKKNGCRGSRPISVVTTACSFLLFTLAQETNALRHLRAHVWTNDSETLSTIPADVDIIFVTLAAATHTNFHQALKQLDDSSRLMDIFVDEAHLIPSWKSFYRDIHVAITSYFKKFIRSSIYFLSASMEPSLVQVMQEYLELTSIEIFRTPCNRSNIAVGITQVPIGKTILHFSASYIRQCMKLVENVPMHRLFVYTNNIHMCNSIYEELRNSTDPTVLQFHSKLSEPERGRILKQFQDDPRALTIIATPGLGQGINSFSTMVICVGPPYSVTDFYQQAGRTGRKTPYGVGTIIVDIQNPPNQNDAVTNSMSFTAHANISHQVTELIRLKSCYRKCMTAIIDGDEGLNCLADSRSLPCGYCFHNELTDRNRELLEKSSSELVRHFYLNCKVDSIPPEQPDIPVSSTIETSTSRNVTYTSLSKLPVSTLTSTPQRIQEGEIYYPDIG